MRSYILYKMSLDCLYNEGGYDEEYEEKVIYVFVCDLHDWVCKYSVG
jgi:hypothetical protein